MLVRRRVEFGLEDARTFLILAQRKRSPVTLHIEQHQPAVGGLVEPVESQPALRVPDGITPGVAGDAVVGKQGQQRSGFPVQVLALGGQPKVKVRAIARRQMDQQIIGIERDRSHRHPPARRAEPITRMVVTAYLLDGSTELVHVDPAIGAGAQGHQIAVTVQPLASISAQHLAQPVKTTAQVGACVGAVGPQQQRQRAARVRAAVHRQVGKQRDHLAAIQCDRNAIDLYVGNTK